MIALIIKGNRAQAIEAAIKRNTQCEFICETNSNTNTVAQTDTPFKTIAAWFTESNSAPYPAGSLLYFYDPTRDNDKSK